MVAYSEICFYEWKEVWINEYIETFTEGGDLIEATWGRVVTL